MTGNTKNYRNRILELDACMSLEIEYNLIRDCLGDKIFDRLYDLFGDDFRFLKFRNVENVRVSEEDDKGTRTEKTAFIGRVAVELEVKLDPTLYEPATMNADEDTDVYAHIALWEHERDKDIAVYIDEVTDWTVYEL